MQLYICRTKNEKTKKMKSTITLLLAVLFINFTNGQSKIGTIDSEFVIGKMPQMKQVIQRVNKYGKKLDSLYQAKVVTYKSKIEAYKKVEKTLSIADKKAKTQEIIALEQDMNQFRENGNNLMQLRKNQYMRPLYKKVSETIQKIAKEQHYTQILTTSGNEFAYIDEKFDITKLVLKTLGIKIEEAKK